MFTKRLESPTQLEAVLKAAGAGYFFRQFGNMAWETLEERQGFIAVAQWLIHVNTRQVVVFWTYVRCSSSCN